jgi:putative heme-binding domain-containing protein
MEWDFGMPWYRPTRICHATSASEFGWRTGNSKWPANFPDNLPPVINIGQGSPTNLLYLKNAKFPAKYNQSLLAFDWSFGIIHAIHLKPSGATYTAEREEFLSGIPLPLTDGTIGPDGALYFLTGGRRLESDLYRVYYNGPENTQNPVSTTKINPENELRRTLEKFHNKQDATVIYFAWPHLKHPDRFVRYAARLAIEHQPSQEWQQKALTEKDPIIAINSLQALTRNTDANNKDKILAALLKINFNILNEEQKIDLLRVYELVFLRLGKPDEQTKTKIATYFFSRFPTISKVFDQHLARILVNVDSPGIIEKIVSKITNNASASIESVGGNTATNSADLILRNPQYGLDIAQMLDNKPPALQVYYAILISNVKTGWTPALSERYFSWYKKAFTYKGGLSYVGFLERARKMALQNVPENKKGYYDNLSGGDLLNKTGNDIIVENYPKGPYKYWNADETNKLFETELVNRDYKQGKSMYDAVTCSRCHSMLGQGGNIGPDLSQLASRFTTKDILEAIMEPNKVISDQYASTQFELKNGQSIVGRLVNEDKVNYSISQNPYAPDFLLKVAKNTVVSKKYSTVSVMLPGLINPLNQEELKDLMAFLIAGGKQDHKVFLK